MVRWSSCHSKMSHDLDVSQVSQPDHPPNTLVDCGTMRIVAEFGKFWIVGANFCGIR